MKLQERGQERRCISLNVFSGKCRRKSLDRREFGFISSQKLYLNTPYHEIEPILKKCQICVLEIGEVLLSPDQNNSFVYLIKSGKFIVKVTDREEEEGFPISAGEFIGELSVLDDQMVSAHVAATERSEILKLHKDLFYQHLRSLPNISRNIIRVQSQRLRLQNELTVKNQQHILLANAMDVSNVAYWSWNMQTDTTYSNDIFLGMLGYSRGELENTRQAWLSLVNKEDTKHFFCDGYRSVYENSNSHTIEFRMMHRNGFWVWIESTAKVVNWSPSGTPLRMSGVHKDISEKKNALLQLQKAKDEAVIANEAKSNFIADLSHELRTPLNAIIGYSQLLQMDSVLTKNHKEDAGEILKAGLHLLEFINDILDLSHLERGSSDVQLSSIAISPIVNDCLSLILPRAKERQIRIEHDTFLFKNIYAMASEKELKQILLNLLSNAVKYNKDSGEISITSKVVSKKRIRLIIKDTGIGLTEKQVERLFVPFERLGREKSTIEGTGIGLSITKRLVEALGGNIGVVSKENEGSSFWVELDSSIPQFNLH